MTETKPSMAQGWYCGACNNYGEYFDTTWARNESAAWHTESWGHVVVMFEVPHGQEHLVPPVAPPTQ